MNAIIVGLQRARNFRLSIPMPNGLDLDILAIHRRGSYTQANLPGLHVAAPPRRLARRRADDILVLFLELKGNSPLTASQQTQLLEGVSKKYYEQRGSVTAAMHAAAGALNHYLLDRNRRSASSGLQSVGLLAMIVTRGDQVFLGQSGPVHAFVVSDAGSQHIYDTSTAGRGLGTTQKTPVRFTHAGMQQGGLLVISPAPPPTWTVATLSDRHKARLEVLHRDLTSQSGPDLKAVICQVQPGTGQVHLLQPRPQKPVSAAASPMAPGQVTRDHIPAPDRGAATPPRPAMRPEQAPDRPTEAPLEAPIAPVPSIEEGFFEGGSVGLTAETPVETVTQVPALPSSGTAPADIRPPAVSGSRARRRRTTSPEAVKAVRARRPVLGPILLSASRVLSRGLSAFGQGLRALLARMMPGEGLITLPASVMMTMAIAVPVIFVAIATVVYYDRGLAAQHQVYVNQASQKAAQTIELSEPDDLRRAWASVLDLLDIAAAYGSTPEAEALYEQAQTALDQLEGVSRLAFEEALTTRLTDAVRIGRMVATNEDLYLLNSEDGSILRSWRTGRGYEFDPTFRCGPGAYGSLIVGRLIDLTALPKGNEFNATVLGMDINGNLLYCIPGQSPIAAPLVPPDSNWGNPLAITFDSGSLYILDPQTNAVWMYIGINGAFNDRPRLYFGDDIPPMKDVIDFAANRQDLYLLHEDGHLTTCTFSAVAASPTRCDDPALFVDSRPGRQDTPLIEGARFNQILFNPPPDPSIFLMDTDEEALYHFSVRLTFQRQFRSGASLGDGDVTSFAVSPDRTVFLGVGNRIFYATMP